MKKIKLLLASLAFVSLFGLSLFVAPGAGAINPWGDCSGANANTTICKGTGDEAKKIVSPIVTTMLIILGSISVIMIIIGGIMYSVSAGDPAKTKKAKDTVLYSVIGLVVAMLAYPIIAFVLSKF